MPSNYKAPGIAVHQTIQQNVIAATPDQNVAIIGPNANLTLYNTTAAEQAKSYVGEYTIGADAVFDWVRGIGDENVDLEFTKVYFRNALLQYGSISATLLANKFNQLSVDVAGLSDRGIQVGDAVKVTIADTDYYSAIYAVDTVVNATAVTAAPTVPAAENATAVAAISATTTANSAATTSGITLAVTADAGDYVPVAGSFVENYTIRVLSGGATPSLQIVGNIGGTSAIFTPIDGTAVTTAVTGLELTFTIGSNTLQVGQEWYVEVKTEYTVPAITVSGTFNGNEDITYIIDVKRGGRFADAVKPVVRVRTVSGDDTVNDIEVTSGSTYLLGTKGMTFTVASGNGLSQGDSWEYVVTAVSDSTGRVLTLQQNLPVQATDLTLTADLSIVRNLQIGDRYFTQDQNSVTINGSIIANDWEFENTTLPVIKADAYIERRIWNNPQTTSRGFGEINNATELEEILPGALHPDNPLKYAIYKALQNCGGTRVLYAIVRQPGDVASWQDAFNRLSKNRNAYEIVPLTLDEAVKTAAVNWVLSESTDAINRRKECWIYQGIDLITPIITFDHSDPTLATVIANPNSTARSINFVLAKTGDFVAAGVRPGDELRIGYYTDADGNYQYESRLVSRIINSNTLIVDIPFTEVKGIAQRYEIWRPTTSANFEEQIAQLNQYNNRRIIAVYPFQISADGYTNLPGYYGPVLAAARTAALMPNRASTLKTLTGITDIVGYDELSETNLDELAVNGVTMFAKDENDNIYIRHTLTTGPFETIHEREEMTTRNFDNISNFYTAALMPLRGQITATNEGLAAVYDVLVKASDRLMLRYRGYGTSGQLVNYEVVSLALDPTFQDTINAYMNLELPYMANRIELYLTVVATNSAATTDLGTAGTGLTATV